MTSIRGGIRFTATSSPSLMPSLRAASAGFSVVGATHAVPPEISGPGWKIADFLRIRYGGTDDAKRHLGPVPAIRDAFAGIQAHLFRPRSQGAP